MCVCVCVCVCVCARARARAHERVRACVCALLGLDCCEFVRVNEKDRQTDRQINKQTDRHTGRPRDRTLQLARVYTDCRCQHSYRWYTSNPPQPNETNPNPKGSKPITVAQPLVSTIFPQQTTWGKRIHSPAQKTCALGNRPATINMQFATAARDARVRRTCACGYRVCSFAV